MVNTTMMLKDVSIVLQIVQLAKIAKYAILVNQFSLSQMEMSVYLYAEMEGLFDLEKNVMILTNSMEMAVHQYVRLRPTMNVKVNHLLVLEKISSHLQIAGMVL